MKRSPGKTFSPPLLDAERAAARLGVSVRQFWRFVERDEIPRVVFGRRCVRFLPEDLEAFVEERRCASAEVTA